MEEDTREDTLYDSVCMKVESRQSANSRLSRWVGVGWKGAERRCCSSGGPREDEVNRTDIFLETKLISEAKAKIDLALFSSLPHPHLT